LVLVDPGIDGADLNELANDLDRLGLPVVAGSARGGRPGCEFTWDVGLQP
jgi:hypothetical protein